MDTPDFKNTLHSASFRFTPAFTSSCSVLTVHVLSFALTPGGHHYPWGLRGRGSFQRWQAVGRRPNPGGARTYNEQKQRWTWNVEFWFDSSAFWLSVQIFLIDWFMYFFLSIVVTPAVKEKWSSTWICPHVDLMLCHGGKGRGGAQAFSHSSLVRRPELKGTHMQTHSPDLIALCSSFLSQSQTAV